MDLEDDEFRAMAAGLGIDTSSVVTELASAVRGVTVGHYSELNLRDLTVAQLGWKKGVNPTGVAGFHDFPPVVAFLALSVLAAQHMGEDSDFGVNAYYPRFKQLIGLPQSDQSTPKQFRKYSEYLWNSLNWWLRSLEGARGLPSAYALGHRYVGLPVSQALLRSTERQRLPEFFDQMGLSAGMQLTPEDMGRYLNSWLADRHNTATNHIRRLWQKTATRERISAIAALELANWDSRLTEGRVSKTTSSRVGLIAALRRKFVGEKFDLALMLKPTNDFAGEVETFSADGNWLPVPFSPLANGLWRTSQFDDVDGASVLDGLVRMRVTANPDEELTRRPRPVVPLVFDELQSAFLERDRLQLGVDSMILARIESEILPHIRPADHVQEILERHARPGFQRITAVDGLPDGWNLFVDIQLFSSAQEARYEELKPLASTQLTIAGGLRIPSRIRKWSTLAPPEIRASTTNGRTLRVELSDATDTGPPLAQWTADDGALVVALDNRGIVDGDYTISLFVDNKDSPVQQANLRLRSSNQTDPGWDLTTRLAYSVGGAARAAGAISAGIDFDAPCVDGGTSVGHQMELPAASAMRDFSWIKPRTNSTTTARRLQIGVVDPSSCALTGAHRIQLPTAYGGRATSRHIEGTCESCGIVKQYPAWIPRNPRGRYQRRNSNDAQPVAAATTVDDLRPVAEIGLSTQRAALDALKHLGGGEVRSLLDVAAQIDGSSLFGYTYVNNLEWLGHIAVERDELGKPVRWEISPACAVALEDESQLLIGFWPEFRIDELQVSMEEAGARVSMSHAVGWLMGPRVEGATEEMLASSLTESETMAPQAVRAILRALPPLSRVAEDLPRVAVPGFESLERFDVSSAQWTPAGHMDTAGAYRVRRGFERLNLFRSTSDCDNGRAVVGPAYLVKHLAANAAGTTLMRFNERSRSLLVPLGCELPGMYGRAAVLTSGHLPVNVKITLREVSRRAHAYEQVHEDDADLLHTLLTG